MYHQIEPKLEITKQPQKNLRFRYESEAGTHGVLNGRSAVDEFPEITLKIPTQNYGMNFYAVTNLYKPTNSSSFAQDEYLELAEELLAEKSKKEPSYAPIIEPMQQINQTDYTFSLKNYYILRQKKSQIENTLRRKYEEMEKFTSGDIGQLRMSPEKITQIESIIKTRKQKEQKPKQVCLGFSVYMKNPYNQYNLFCGPVLTEPINDGEDLRIVKNCNSFSKCGDEVTLLVSDAQQNEIEVYLYEIREGKYDENSSQAILWNHSIGTSKIKVHKRAAVSFSMPEYTGSTQDASISCRVMLKRPKHGDESSSVRIVYLPDISSLPLFFEEQWDINSLESHTESSGNFTSGTMDTSSDVFDDLGSIPKRQRITGGPLQQLTEYQWFKDSVEDVQNTQSAISKSKVIEKDILALSERLEHSADVLKSLQTEQLASNEEKTFELLCYDAIRFDGFPRLCEKIIEKFNLESKIQKIFSTQRGGTLLHYASQMNKWQVLGPLIRMGCEVHAMDVKRQTPLHLAIKSKHQECIDIFQKLLDNTAVASHTNVGCGLDEDFKRLLAIYDENGLTVLHRAVLANQLKLVQSILDFCKNRKITIDRYEVLGEGETILHLAASKGLKEMAQLIHRHDPNSIFYQNYAGDAIIDDEETIQELELKSEM